MPGHDLDAPVVDGRAYGILPTSHTAVVAAAGRGDDSAGQERGRLCPPKNRRPSDGRAPVTTPPTDPASAEKTRARARVTGTAAVPPRLVSASGLDKTHNGARRRGCRRTWRDGLGHSRVRPGGGGPARPVQGAERGTRTTSGRPHHLLARAGCPVLDLVAVPVPPGACRRVRADRRVADVGELPSVPEGTRLVRWRLTGDRPPGRGAAGPGRGELGRTRVPDARMGGQRGIRQGRVRPAPRGTFPPRRERSAVTAGRQEEP